MTADEMILLAIMLLAWGVSWQISKKENDDP